MNVPEPRQHGLSADLIPSALQLSAEPGWNQVAADWRWMIEHGTSFGYSAPDGALVASGLTVIYDRAPFAWISMILVTAAFRRRGLATRLMQSCIEALEARGLVPALDASPEGRQVYLPLGFRDGYRTSRFLVQRAPTAGSKAIRPLRAEDMPAVIAYDSERAGGERGSLLRHLHGRLPLAAWIAELGGRVAGYVLGRDGRLCPQLGPLIADDEATALALLEAAGASLQGPFCIDAGDHHKALARWLERHDAQFITPFVRMLKGREGPYDNPAKVFAIAGPELG
jgi:ribosomal protein S18 acetylase RimI-like enzyme